MHLAPPVREELPLEYIPVTIAVRARELGRQRVELLQIALRDVRVVHRKSRDVTILLRFLHLFSMKISIDPQALHPCVPGPSGVRPSEEVHVLDPRPAQPVLEVEIRVVIVHRELVHADRGELSRAVFARIVEVAELNELFLWKTVEESEKVNRDKLREELADVLAYTLMLAGKHGFDIKEIVLEKIRKNNEKYPVDRSKGSAKKYNEL